MGKQKKVRTPLKTDNQMLIKCFLIVSFISVLLTTELTILSNGAYLQDTLFWNGAYSDHFMDFFNTIRDSHDLTWVYQRNTIYPPLSVLIMYFFASLMPADLASLPFARRYEMQASQICIMLFFIIAFICILLLAKMIDTYMEHAGVNRFRYLVTFFIVISFPLTYCVERGNTSVIALVGCTFFLFFRNSENKVLKELALISLALAAGLKIFPAALGVILLYDRKYKEAARTIGYGILTFLLPFVIVKLLTPQTGLADQVVQQMAEGSMSAETNTDGSLLRLFQNLLSWINKKTYFMLNSSSIANVFYLLNKMNLVKISAASMLGTVSFIATELVAFVLGFFCKKDWQKMFCACYLMLNIHAIAMHYTLIYVIPVFIAFLCEKTSERKHRNPLDWLYFALFGLIMIPLPYLFYSFKNTISAWIFIHFNITLAGNVNKIFSGFAFQLIFICLVIEISVSVIRDLRKKKANESEEKGSVQSVPAEA